MRRSGTNDRSGGLVCDGVQVRDILHNWSLEKTHMDAVLTCHAHSTGTVWNTGGGNQTIITILVGEDSKDCQLR